MTQTIKAVRGMNDMLPEPCYQWERVQSILIAIARQYGYGEIRYPIVESTQLFKRSVGEVTDIVEKEMYTFTDRNGDSLSLRPEGTAGCVRAAIEQGILYNQQQRLWYHGPMFRHERPQRGRYRQFYHFGVETFGFAGAEIDAEIICMSARFWQALGIHQDVRLELNSIGSPASRQIYREVLVDYFSQNRDQLDEDSLRRLSTNPLRILDSKNPLMQSLNDNAPKLLAYLDDDSKRHFDVVCDLLSRSNIAYTVNPRLVRGIDYYTETVFEWVTTKLGSQGTVCAGGRYDLLVEQLGGPSTPGCGFAIGMERLMELIDANQFPMPAPDIIVLAAGQNASGFAFAAAEQLRINMPSRTIIFHQGDSSFKRLMKRADKSQARVAFIIGEDELRDKSVTLKFMKGDREQETIALSRAAEVLQAYFNG